MNRIFLMFIANLLASICLFAMESDIKRAPELSNNFGDFEVPEELILDIAGYLDLEDLLVLSATSKQLQSLLFDKSFVINKEWRQLFEKYFYGLRSGDTLIYLDLRPNQIYNGEELTSYDMDLMNWKQMFFYASLIISHTNKNLILDSSNHDKEYCNFKRAELLIDSNLSHALLYNVKLPNFTFSNVCMVDAKLAKAELCIGLFYDVDMTNAQLTKAGLFESGMHRVSFYNAYMRKANISYTSILDSDMRYAKLIKANMSCVILSNTNLWRADLSGADLSEARLSDVNICYADFSGANLKCALIKEQYVPGEPQSNRYNLITLKRLGEEGAVWDPKKPPLVNEVESEDSED